MVAPVYKTRQQLRDELKLRLGFGAMVGVSQIQDDLMNHWLASAQRQLIMEYPDAVMKYVEDYDNPNITTVANQVLYEIPDLIDPYRLHVAAVKIGNDWLQMRRGINLGHRDFTGNGYPTNFDIKYDPTLQRAVIEIWPTPRAAYEVAFEYFLREVPMDNDTDRTVVDDELVLLHALTTAKAHYNQNDAGAIGNQYERRLRRMRSASHENKIFTKLGNRDRRCGSGCGGESGGRMSYETTSGVAIQDFTPLLSETGDFLVPE